MSERVETNERAIVVLITAGSRVEALRLAEMLVEKRLVACAQILPEMTSIYHWQGAIQRDTEILLLAKTVSACFAELEQTVRAHHSYETPEIIAIPASEISTPYFTWLVENVTRSKDEG